MKLYVKTTMFAREFTISVGKDRWGGASRPYKSAPPLQSCGARSWGQVEIVGTDRDPQGCDADQRDRAMSVLIS